MIMEHELLDLMLVDEEIKEVETVKTEMESAPKGMDKEVEDGDLFRIDKTEVTAENEEPDQCQFCDRKFESHLELNKHVVNKWASQKSCLLHSNI